MFLLFHSGVPVHGPVRQVGAPEVAGHVCEPLPEARRGLHHSSAGQEHQHADDVRACGPAVGQLQGEAHGATARPAQELPEPLCRQHLLFPQTSQRFKPPQPLPTQHPAIPLRGSFNWVSQFFTLYPKWSAISELLMLYPNYIAFY